MSTNHARKAMDGERLPSMAFYLLLLLLAALLSGCGSQKTVTLALLGDINLGRSVSPSIASFSLLAGELTRADLALANLESPLAENPAPSDSVYDLCAPAEYAGLLAEWGLDLLAVANNHASDCSPFGSQQTRSILESRGLTALTSEPLYREVNGFHLAFLAFDDVTSPLDYLAAAETIHIARASGALVIVSIHWGWEYQGGASDRQKFVAQTFAEAGAALIWGHHPHVLQPAEWIGTGTGRVLVLYSLGNALFDQYGLDDTRRSALVLVTLDHSGVKAVELTPFVIDENRSLLVAPDAITAEIIRKRLHLP